MFGLLKKLRKRNRKLTVEHLINHGFERELAEIIVQVAPYTMTSPERIAALCDAVQYVVANDVPGAMVECGVWRGGSMMAVAKTLKRLDACNRELHLFDTFAGMTTPTEQDIAHDGASAAHLLREHDPRDARSVWCVSHLDEVVSNLASTCYPQERVHYAEGPVEETLPGAGPDEIAILRLDTDWYESTAHELKHLFPRLSPGGVLIVDDYGYWQGARRAVDEYFAENNIPMLLMRIDFTGRIGVYHPTSEATTIHGGRCSEAA